jgi:hypothetical protein
MRLFQPVFPLFHRKYSKGAMKVVLCLSSIFLFLHIMQFPALCDEEMLLQKTGFPGAIDWIQRNAYVHLSFESEKTVAEDSLKTSIYDTMRGILSEIVVDRERTIKDLLKSSPEMSEKLDAFIRGNLHTDRYYLSDGTVEISSAVPLERIFRELVLEPPVRKGSPIVRLHCPLCDQPWPEGKPVPKGFEQIMKGVGSLREHHTGLVIRVKDLVFLPCLSPRIINEDESAIYDLTFADFSVLLDEGLLSYHYSSEGDDALHGRVGENPLVISAIGVAGRNRTDLVLSTEDSKLIHSTFHNLQFLSQCRVAVVVMQ